jgi:hypothetical protein
MEKPPSLRLPALLQSSRDDGDGPTEPHRTDVSTRVHRSANRALSSLSSPSPGSLDPRSARMISMSRSKSLVPSRISLYRSNVLSASRRPRPAAPVAVSHDQEGARDHNPISHSLRSGIAEVSGPHVRRTWPDELVEATLGCSNSREGTPRGSRSTARGGTLLNLGGLLGQTGSKSKRMCVALGEAPGESVDGRLPREGVNPDPAPTRPKTAV